MKNAVSSGENLELTAPAGGVVSGKLYKVGEHLGVALFSAAAGEKFTLGVEGVYDVEKNTGVGESFAEGAECFLDDATGKVSSDDAAASHPKVGDVVGAAAEGDTTVEVKLNRASHK